MNTYVPPLLTTAFTTFGVIGHGGPQGPQNVIDEINAVTDPNTGAPSLGLTVVQSTTPLQTAGDIPNVIQSVVSQGAQALYVCTDPLITSKAASTAINAAGMPTMHAFKKNLGGSGSNKLLYLGYELTDLFSQIADIIYNWRTTPGAPFAAPTTPTGSIKKQPSS
jgi:hypothetical protein